MLWRSGGYLFATLFRIVPRRHRFTVATTTAQALRPLIQRSRAYALRMQQQTDTTGEVALDLVLMTLTRHGTEFDPRITCVGSEHLPDPSDRRPTLFVSPHTMMSMFLLRILSERKVPVAVIAADPTMRVPGTREPVRVVAAPDRNLLVTVHGVLRTGVSVCAMIDRAQRERRTVPVPTSRGVFHISTALLEIALRVHVRVVFLTGTYDPARGVTVILAAPSEQESTSVAGLVAEFGRFIETYVHADR